MASLEGLKLTQDDDAVRSSVSKYYGETLQGSSDLKTSACCTAKAPPAAVRRILEQLPQEITARYYGCGSPFPVGLQGSGLRVLDLGCGTGRDCYVAAALVGPQGFVTGVDMTDAQLVFAAKHSTAWQHHLGYAQPNMRFVKGSIEQLSAAGIAPGSVDLVISNCVVNLCPDKPAVLAEAYKALADGGEFYFSDMYCDRRMPAAVRSQEVLLGEGLGGSLAVNDFVRLARQAGFSDPRVLDARAIEVYDPQLRQMVGEARFYSVTFRLFKLPGQLEAPPQEDYGQTVTYQGSIPEAGATYTLDSQHTFPAGVPVRVSGNTAAMLGGSWLSRHFTLSGPKTQHMGQFKPDSSSSSSGVVDGAYIATLAAGSSSAGGGGGCCPSAQPAAAAAAASGCNGTTAKQASCCSPDPAVTPAAAAGCCAGSNSGNEQPGAAAGKGGSCCAPGAAPCSSGGCC